MKNDPHIPKLQHVELASGNVLEPDDGPEPDDIEVLDPDDDIERLARAVGLLP
jgi:hypothetical protein